MKNSLLVQMLMNKLTLLLSLLFLTACGTSYAPQAIADIVTASPKPEKQATATPVPSPTIGYESTITAKQNELDAIIRQNAQITAEHEQGELEKIQLTAEYEQREYNKYILDTSLTSTQQVIANTAKPRELAALETQQVIHVLDLRATEQYPALIKEIEDTKNYVKYGGAYNVLGLVGLFALIIALFSGAAAIIKYWVLHPETTEDDEEETEEQTPVTRINLYKNNGAHSELHDVPCTPDQLTEFADGYVNKKITLRINNWEGANTLWTRDYYKPFREWMKDAELVVSEIRPDGATRYMPVEPNLSDFLRGWLTTRQLPNGYEFQEQTKQAEPDYSGELVPVTR